MLGDIGNGIDPRFLYGRHANYIAYRVTFILKVNLHIGPGALVVDGVQVRADLPKIKLDGNLTGGHGEGEGIIIHHLMGNKLAAGVIEHFNKLQLPAFHDGKVHGDGLALLRGSGKIHGVAAIWDYNFNSVALLEGCGDIDMGCGHHKGGVGNGEGFAGGGDSSDHLVQHIARIGVHVNNNALTGSIGLGTNGDGAAFDAAVHGDGVGPGEFPKVCANSNLGCGHHEGIVRDGDGYRIAVSIEIIHRQIIQLIALVRGDGQGDGVALSGERLIRGDGAEEHHTRKSDGIALSDIHLPAGIRPAYTGIEGTLQVSQAGIVGREQYVKLIFPVLDS